MVARRPQSSAVASSYTASAAQMRGLVITRLRGVSVARSLAGASEGAAQPTKARRAKQAITASPMRAVRLVLLVRGIACLRERVKPMRRTIALLSIHYNSSAVYWTIEIPEIYESVKKLDSPLLHATGICLVSEGLGKVILGCLA